MATTTTVLITGNTYPVKDALKAIGARWDADSKGWRVPAAKEAEARAIVAKGGSVATASKPAYRPMKCRECGVSASSLRAPYEKILRNGMCTGCYRDQRDGYGD